MERVSDKRLAEYAAVANNPSDYEIRLIARELQTRRRRDGNGDLRHHTTGAHPMTTPTLAEAIEIVERSVEDPFTPIDPIAWAVVREAAERSKDYAADLDDIHAACLPFGALHPDPYGALGRILAMSTRNRQIVDQENRQ